jgi:hypothetical protein
MTPAEHQALLRKYRQLTCWRAARDAEADPTGTAAPGSSSPSSSESSSWQGAPASRVALRALSEEFPGCLRELDVLGAAELRRRVAVLEGTPSAAAQATDAPDWMLWVAAYHRLMRAALAARRMMARAERLAGLSGERLVHLRGAAMAIAGELVDDAFIQAVAAPPGGRLSPMVLGVLARQFNVPATHISNILFPPRRPPPYVLG